MTLIRTPAVAGQFYSGNAGELGATVATLLEEAQDRDTPSAQSSDRAACRVRLFRPGGRHCLRPAAAVSRSVSTSDPDGSLPPNACTRTRA